MMSMRSAAFLSRTWWTTVKRSTPTTQTDFECLWHQNDKQDNKCSIRCFSSKNADTESRVKLPLEAWSNYESSTELPTIPDYLRDEYSWAYGHPWSIRALDHKCLVNLVLWGNFEMLREACIQELSDSLSLIHGPTLQVACVYADFTQTLVERLSPSACLHVVDVIPMQLDNLKRKLPSTNTTNITLTCNDAQDMRYHDDSFDQVVLFFLLHEMPNDVRICTLKQACRVLRPGGKLVVMDYHRPKSMRWQKVMSSMFRLYEPFALEMWNNEIQEWLPHSTETSTYNISKELYCDGLYQKVVVTKK